MIYYLTNIMKHNLFDRSSVHKIIEILLHLVNIIEFSFDIESFVKVSITKEAGTNDTSSGERTRRRHQVIHQC